MDTELFYALQQCLYQKLEAFFAEMFFEKKFILLVTLSGTSELIN